jgi:hypothetical protein
MDKGLLGINMMNLVVVGGPYRHIYTTNISPKRKELHVSTHIYFATNRIPLVLEELTLCRNIHQIQVEYIKKGAIWESVMPRQEEEAHQRTKPGPTHGATTT